MKLINRLIEPKRILLIWQPAEMGKRFIVGEILHTEAKTALKYYDSQEVDEAKKKGFNGLTAYPFEPNKEYNGNLVDILSRRLPPSTRTDYDDYLKSYRISPSAEGRTTLSLLAYTAGRLEGDGFSFMHTFEGTEPPFDCVFEIAGFRHHDGMQIDPINSLIDKTIEFKDDNANLHDQEALAIYYMGKKLGYVPRGLNIVLRKFIHTHQVNAFITKVNGTLQRPNVLVYVEIT